MTTDAAAPGAPCMLCGARGAARVAYRLPRFDVVECAGCGGRSRDPLPDDAEMASYYSDPAYIDGRYFDAATGDDARANPEVAMFREALAHLASRRRGLGLPAAGRVLDVGAGSGGFLAEAVAAGWTASGVELSPELADRARSRTGATVECGDFSDLPLERLGEGTWDAVTMWDLLEHVRDPGAVLDRARRLLAPHGVLVVFTIDAASLFNVVAHVAWRATGGALRSPLELLYDKRHNWYFTSRSLRALLGRHGFAVEHAAAHRAHLQRWLSEPAGAVVLAGAAVVDALSVPLGRLYRQLLYCTAPTPAACPPEESR